MKNEVPGGSIKSNLYYQLRKSFTSPAGDIGLEEAYTVERMDIIQVDIKDYDINNFPREIKNPNPSKRRKTD